MIVLGIETSCDETAVSVVSENEILAELVYSQKVHSAYGGVIPELASRQHIKKLYPMMNAIWEQSGILPADINIVAVTSGPGLPGALIIGTLFAKGFAFARKIPIIPINHLEGHIFAAKLGCDDFEPPFLALLVSGGHTEIIRVDDWGIYETLGNTRDDAAGEAFDKVARVLGLPYPGGPEIQKLAEIGDSDFIDFPRPMLNSGDLDFSFSGLKTAVINLLYDWGREKVEQNLSHICASFQEAVVDTLLGKIQMAVEKTGIHTITIVGGVAANKRLRKKASQLDADVCIPPLKYCTDNATIIAMAGMFHFSNNHIAPISFNIHPGWKL
ncbi:tRNA (adenosine(37)-N6)-threonylcarbamoyltransferase complex transferase subunit TsaD [bacterium]|nr:MAG: tRNA (adenosine(37)-N6)-threonylcarbamoyltransferase complex transferase subunit TsaD [bacterium]